MYDLVDICKYANKYNYEMFYYAKYGKTDKLSLEVVLDIYDYFSTNYPNEWSRAFKDNYNYYHKVERLKKRILSIIRKPSVFLSITFNNLTINSTTSETRRRYVVRYLKTFGVPFVANKDYGAQKGREHYHAVIQSQNIDYTSFGYGAVNGEKIRYIGDDDVKLAKYLVKLANHAVKDSVKGSRIIYSRG